MFIFEVNFIYNIKFIRKKLMILIVVILQPVNSIWPAAILSSLRTIFIPLMMICNAKPRYYLPVLINNDQLYAIIMSIFGFTNGIVNNITMASIPQ